YMVRNKKATFYFDQGKGHLLWEGLELTSGFGLYASMFAAGFWQDSEHANWRITKINNRKLMMKGRWQFLPIVLTWEIDLEEETEVNLKIEMEVIEKTMIEGEQQFNVMLRSEYDRWSAEDGSAGNFPGAFNENWVNLFEKELSRVKTVRAESVNSKLPAISLACKFNNNEYLMSALNTSSLFHSRILKCYKIDKKHYSPGTYNYFYGRLKIDNS
ncbi:hypothetical protein ACFL1D_06090, partial [Candidatus Omnitrophota bacterium]